MTLWGLNKSWWDDPAGNLNNLKNCLRGGTTELYQEKRLGRLTGFCTTQLELFVVLLIEAKRPEPINFFSYFIHSHHHSQSTDFPLKMPECLSKMPSFCLFIANIFRPSLIQEIKLLKLKSYLIGGSLPRKIAYNKQHTSKCAKYISWNEGHKSNNKENN